MPSGKQKTHAPTLVCEVRGVGAWGPGFDSWDELKTLLATPSAEGLVASRPPKPEIIPANERRRAPLPVKIAVDTSWQAVQASGIPAADLACVFGSGFGDTEITDYMCRALNTELKQLSPTKFHNSVHNAAAGYWTISTDCMKAANSIAAYYRTAGLALMEAASQCALEDEAVLITLFDTAAYRVYQQIFDCQESFAAAIIIAPSASDTATQYPQLNIKFGPGPYQNDTLETAHLDRLRQDNPAARILPLLAALTKPDREQTTTLELSSHHQLVIDVITP